MLKKITTFVLALLVGLQPLMASAADLDAAFTNLLGPGTALSVNRPGNYQSGARNSFVAGGLELRVPRSSGMPQLFSVTPPRITAGCGGISAHFGGFSFISGAEFQQLLKSIASGAALGFVSMMVMKTLCPPCEAVVQFLKTAAQQAARLAKDSCKWGQDLAKSFMAGTSSTTNTQQVCGTTISTNGTSNDFLGVMEGLDSACSSMRGAVDALLGENQSAQSNPNDKAALACETGFGNITWQRLAAFDVAGASAGATGAVAETGYQRKLLIMNMLGIDLNTAEANKAYCELEDGTVLRPEETKDNNVFCPPTLRSQDVVGLFMCGAPDSSGKPTGSDSSRVAEYCQTFYANSGSGSGGSFSNLSAQKIYTCKDDKANCNELVPGPATDIINGQGFLVHINNLLRQGVKAVREDAKMPDDVIRLMQVAPYPLYQAINAAAVYPTAADDLVDAMSILVAEQVTVAYLDDSLRLEGRAGGKQRGCLSSKQASTILDAVAQMRVANRARLQQIGQNIAAQEAISEQIRQINLTIQKQVMNQDMLATGRYADAVGRALSPNVSRADAGPAAP